MEDSGAILSRISSLKDMLDQVNEEIEVNLQITREIESGIVKCSEIESELATRQSKLMKMSSMLQFEIVGYVTVTTDLRASVCALEKTLCSLKMKKAEMDKRMSEKRENFMILCLEFQKDIDKNEIRTLLSEKDSLENEIQTLDKKINVLKNSVLAFVEEILQDLHSSNSDLCDNVNHLWRVTNAAVDILSLDLETFGRSLEVNIQRRNWENEKLQKDINDLKTTLLSAIGTSGDLL